MKGPFCQSVQVRERRERTELGDRRLRGGEGGREFTERTGTPVPRLQYPSDGVCLVVLWRLRFN
jgi:hypothetical protein